MHDNILDEELEKEDKYSGSRTCPECGYQFPYGKFVRQYAMSYGGVSKWTCRGCGELITCDFVKIQFFWLAGLLFFGFLFAILTLYVDLGSWNVIFLIPFFAFVFGTFYYVKFQRYKESGR